MLPNLPIPKTQPTQWSGLALGKKGGQRNDALLAAANAEPGTKSCDQKHPRRSGNSQTQERDEHHSRKIDGGK